jgi:hypothetical protein
MVEYNWFLFFKLRRSDIILLGSITFDSLYCRPFQGTDERLDTNLGFSQIDLFDNVWLKPISLLPIIRPLKGTAMNDYLHTKLTG